MILQTKIPIPKQPNNLIDYNSNLLLLGSCFSENIGDKFSYYKFQSYQNPFGILFHPKAIENLIQNSVHQKEYTEEDLFFLNECWNCFDVHSNLSSDNKIELLKNLNKKIQETYTHIQNASHIIITLGTSWVYNHKQKNETVANCHKVPQKEFSKEILSTDEITESLARIYQLIESINSETKIIFTVSPVRHIKDGFVENQRSKSHLISAIHQLLSNQESNSKLKIEYFPSYEIMMDELRDYRFYNEDMIHPNKIAIQYIWKKFINTWISDEAQQTIQKVEEIQKGLNHKPFNPNSEAHLKFLKNLAQKKETLIKAFPHISF